MEKDGLLAPMRAQSPPPYNEPSYPRRRRHHRAFVRGMLSVRTALSVVLTSCVLWLCYTVSRDIRWRKSSSGRPSMALLRRFDDAVSQCRSISKVPSKPEPETRKFNPRWSSKVGQQTDIILKNATLFDGEEFVTYVVDIHFSQALIKSIAKTGQLVYAKDVIVHDVQGRYVTPGLVDMHSHHYAVPWPGSHQTDDTNEGTEKEGSLVPMMKILDALKPYDIAARLICSGGITSSLIIPGSGNIIGGEGTAVKNVLHSGDYGEPVIEDLLLEKGIPNDERRRYMKMAFGENPKRGWGFTRMGIAWQLRNHMQKAKDLMEKQDEYCEQVSGIASLNEAKRVQFIDDSGKFPLQLELESTVALLRGKVALQNHNYEPEDMQTMLRISEEFGYKVGGFHHATAAWQIPHFLKEHAPNVTIAMFAEFSLYKAEAYTPNLYAGHILDKNGIKVAYKSDHVAKFTYAKYLASQAAVGNAFHLPEKKALQAITSIPAKAMDQDHRIGFCRPGYDADLVVWDAHPLSLGATPMQVFVDGVAQFDEDQVKDSMGATFTSALNGDEPKISSELQVRFEPEEKYKTQICNQVMKPGKNIVITGIRKASVENYPELAKKLSANKSSIGPYEMIIQDGNVVCLDSSEMCSRDRAAAEADNDHVSIDLKNGHVNTGFTAMTNALGMVEIATDDSTGDGNAKGQKLESPDTLIYGKHGVALDGKSFARARLGGVTRAITPPATDPDSYVKGISVEILTSGKKSLLNGGIVQGEVALHVNLDEATMKIEGTFSRAIQKIRTMLKDGMGKSNETVYGNVARGELPLVLRCNSKYDMQQLVMIKQDFPSTNLVIFGGQESSHVAKDLAKAKIPVILSEYFSGPDVFRLRDTLPGPPMSRSVASYLVEAGVEFALAIAIEGMPADYRLHELAPDAAWTAKYSGLSDERALQLVTTNVEKILGLKPSKDLVVFEGNPLRLGATVVLALHGNDETGKLEIATCFPTEKIG